MNTPVSTSPPWNATPGLSGCPADVGRVTAFPGSERDAHGERVYPADQVERLRLIKRLMDQGIAGQVDRRRRRPNCRSLPAPAAGTPSPAPIRANRRPTVWLIELIASTMRRVTSRPYSNAWSARVCRRLSRTPWRRSPGRSAEAWENGSIEVFEEHLFTELTKRLLRQAIATLPASRRPRVLLTSVPDEQHVLGLLMVEAPFAPRRRRMHPLGTQMPLLENQPRR